MVYSKKRIIWETSQIISRRVVRIRERLRSALRDKKVLVDAIFVANVKVTDGGSKAIGRIIFSGGPGPILDELSDRDDVDLNEILIEVVNKVLLDWVEQQDGKWSDQYKDYGAFVDNALVPAILNALDSEWYKGMDLLSRSGSRAADYGVFSFDVPYDY